MIHEFQLPSLDLRKIVHHYERYEFGKNEQQDGHEVLPNFANGFLFCFFRNRPFSVSLGDGKSFEVPTCLLIPPTKELVANNGIRETIIIRVILQPGILLQLYGVPLRAISQQFLPFDQALDPQLKFVYEQLAEVEGFGQQVTIIESYIQEKLKFQSIEKSLFNYLSTMLDRDGYLDSIETIAKKVGYSSRHLGRLLLRETGFNTNEFIRIHRFHRALSHLHSKNYISLGQLAYELDFCDQAHFIKHFKRLAKTTPRNYVSNLKGKIIVEDTDLKFEFDKSGLAIAKGRGQLGFA